MIIEKTYDLLSGRYRDWLETLLISDLVIGAHLTAIRLSDGTIGTAATLNEKNSSSAAGQRDLGDFSPFRIRGYKVKDLLEFKKESCLVLSLKSAALNAISSSLVSTGSYKIIDNCDPIQLVDLNPGKTIVVVGAFKSYIRKISESGCRLLVLEINENALPEEYKQCYVPAGEYRSVIPASDVVIITGQALVNRTIDELLSVVTSGTRVIITGPSCGILPDILFENKVSIIGSMKITDPGILFEVVAEGGTGYHLFEYCATKICILKNDE